MGGMIGGLGRTQYGVGIAGRGIVPGLGGVCMDSGISLVLSLGVECPGWERIGMGCLGIILGFRFWRVIRIFGMGWRGMRRVIGVEICKKWRWKDWFGWER